MSHPTEKTLNGGSSHHSKPIADEGGGGEATNEETNGQVRDNNQQQIPRTPIDEADAVLESLPGGTTYLDGFSLLQVIANPRGNPEDLFSSQPNSTASSFHGRYGSTNTGSAADATDFVTGTFQSLESTVVHVTSQMEALNTVLEGWSRQLLEEDPFGTSSGGEDIPDSQLRELPPALQSLSLHDLQSYLERSGLLAHGFRERQPILEKKAEVEEEPTPKVLAVLREQIPEVFWDASNPVDLTDFGTFREVFLASDPVITTEKVDKKASVFDFFPLVPEESLNPWLDQIELALLEAVREKSSDFFVESVRFGKLQQEIHSLLTQVQQAQSDVLHVQENVVNPTLALPRLDEERVECRKLLMVLDQVQDLLQAKGSIPGYLSAAEDLTALEQVQYGRKQLTQHDEGDDDSLGRRRPLSNLAALQGVAKQLDQYQDLIVTNLREELVEVFMDWKPSSTGLPGNHDRIQDIVRALHNCQGWEATWQAYRNRLHDVLRLTMRTIVGEFSSSPTSSLTVQAFLECLDVTTEQFMTLLQAAVAVKAYCLEHDVFSSIQSTVRGGSDAEIAVQNGETETTTDNDRAVSDIDERVSGVVISSAELAAKSVSELLRLRKEAHSLVSLEEMKQIWDKCSSFSVQLEELTGAKATSMRSTLLSQTKYFAERQHEKHMTSLAAALDSERWIQCQVASERQEKISRLCSGRAILSRGFSNAEFANDEERKPDVLVGGVHYKVVWSCLLLVEMVMNDLSAAAHFTGLSTLMVAKVSELFRLFNARTTQLVLGAGAIHSAARLKSINAKHLSLVTQCLGMVIAIFPHVRAALMAHLPAKQHTLLTSIDTIKKEYAEHNEKVLNKFVTIIGGIVEHGLAPKLAGTDFDVRAEQIKLAEDGSVPSCVFFEGISTNTKKMHQVLVGLLPPDHLQDVFSRIFAFIDQKVPTIIVQASKPQASQNPGGNRSPQRQMSGPRFSFPTTDAGKRRLLLEADAMTKTLNGLEGVQPWDFSTVHVLENRVEYSLHGDHAISVNHEDEDEEPHEEAKESEQSGDTKDMAVDNEGGGNEATVSIDDEENDPVDSNEKETVDQIAAKEDYTEEPDSTREIATDGATNGEPGSSAMTQEPGSEAESDATTKPGDSEEPRSTDNNVSESSNQNGNADEPVTEINDVKNSPAESEYPQIQEEEGSSEEADQIENTLDENAGLEEESQDDENRIAELKSKLTAIPVPEDDEIQGIFEEVDSNGDGELSMPEVEKAIIQRKTQFDLKPEIIMRAFQRADANNDGCISRDEFFSFIRFITYYKNMWNIFASIDTNGDRRLSKAEFLNAANILCIDDPESVFLEMDGNNGGYVVFDEFCVWVAEKRAAENAF